jgi:catechol 2,3-dioxygenase-like lactoylglutathione lyase family enzyme
MKIRKMDHVGIVVDDLDAAKAFFVNLGLEVMNEDTVGEEPEESDWVGRIIGLEGVRDDVAMLRTTDGDTNIELIKFHTPRDENGIQPSVANMLGIRHLAFVVDDLDAVIARLQQNGTELVGEVMTYEDIYKLCYVRGPEGIILELAEELK